MRSFPLTRLIPYLRHPNLWIFILAVFFCSITLSVKPVIASSSGIEQNMRADALLSTSLVSSSISAEGNGDSLPPPISSAPPSGYVPTKLEINSLESLGGADILLVQTSLPWESTANTDILTSLGYSYDIVTMDNIASVDIFRYPVMLIVNDQVQEFYDQYAQQIATFDSYVRNGGVLVFFAASDGWAGGTLQAPLPGDVSVTTPSYETYNYIVDPTYPVVRGQLSDGIALTDGDLYGNYCSHGYFSNLVPGTKVILREENGNPTLIEYQLGSGRVIASTLTWEFHVIYEYGEFARKALDDVFLYAFSQSGVIDGLFNISPASVPADGATSINVTLAGIVPGQRVRVYSSRGSLDTFEPTTGVANDQGRFTTKLRSTSPGESILSAYNLTLNQSLPTTVLAKFTPVTPSQPELPPVENVGIVKITGVSAQHELQGLFPVGLGPIENEIQVTVDWGGKTPGTVLFQMNNQVSVAQPVNNQYAKRTLDFGNMLREGKNTLVITARAQDGTQSAPLSYMLIGWTAEHGWLRPLMDGLPYLASDTAQVLDNQPSLKDDNIEIIIRVPTYPLASKKLAGWLPGKPTTFGLQAMGLLSIPRNGGGYKIDLGASFVRDSSVPGRKPWYGRGLFSILGNNDIEVDLLGNAKGLLATSPPYLSRPDEIEATLKGKIKFNRTESVLVVIEPLAPVGTTIMQTLRSVPPVYDWVKERANFYIEVGVGAGGTAKWIWPERVPELASAKIFATLEIEGGVKIDLYVAEGKVYIGGGGRIDAGLVPQFDFERAALYGIAGAKLKTAWFETSAEGNYELVLYDKNLSGLTARALETLLDEPMEWGLIPRTYIDSDYTSFELAQAGDSLEAFAQASSVQGTTTKQLISNVFPYPEPVIARNENGHALLILTHDDPARELGQGYDLRYSTWDGATWRTPAPVTNDTYPDGRAQVVWIDNTKALAVWQRLDDANLSPDATLDITQTRKFQLAWATYNATTNAWTQPQWLTQESTANAQTPLLARSNDGSIRAVWRSNPQGWLSGDESNPDQIVTAHWNGSGWDAPEIVVSGIPGVFDLAFAIEGNDATLAWTVEAASTGSLTPTLQLFVSRFDGSEWSSPLQVTDSPAPNSHPQIVYRRGSPYIVWIAGDTLTLQPLEDLKIQAFTTANGVGAIAIGSAVQLQSNQQVDQFRVLQDAEDNLFAVFTGQQGNQRDIFLAYYQADIGVWGMPQQITDDQAAENYPAAALNGQNHLLMAYASTRILEEERTATLDNGQVVTFTVPVEGQTDLWTLSHSLRRDLAIESFDISNRFPLPNETIIVTAALANRGDMPLLNAGIVFQDNGTSFDSRTLSSPITAGQVMTVTASFIVPEVGGPRTISAFADPENQIVEIDEDNNRAELVAFGPDLAMEDISTEFWGGGDIDLVTRVANLGTTPSPTATVTYYLANTWVVSDTLPQIIPGEMVTLTTPWNTESVESEQFDLVGVVNPAGTEFQELNTTNNAYTATIRVGPDLMVNPYYLSTTLLTDPQVNITITLFNIGTAPTTDATVAIYRRGNLQANSRIQTYSVDNLEAGSFAVFTDTVTGPLGCGLYIQAIDEMGTEDISGLNNLAYRPADNGRCATFVSFPTEAIAPTTIVFTDTSTGDNTEWLWDFGDGSSSTEQNPTHTYSAPGAFTVTLRVSGEDGSDQFSLSNAVRVYQPAQADFTLSGASGVRPYEVTFENHSTGDIDLYLWDFGDGGTSSVQSPIYTYAEAGTYVASLTVSGLGGTSSHTAVIQVVPFGPPASGVVAASPPEVIADGISSSIIAVTVKDESGNPVVGQQVTFATTLGNITQKSTTNANGTATATLTSPKTVGTATVTAKAGSINGQTQVQFVAGSPASVSVTAESATLIANGSSANLISATVKDVNGNSVPGQQVAFTTTFGSILPSGTTNGNGVATTTLTSATTPATATVTAKAGSINGQTQVHFVVGLPASVSVAAESTVLVADGRSTSLVTAVVKDASGNPVTGQQVTFATTSGSLTRESITLDTTALGSTTVAITTDGNGVATATFTSATLPGKASVTVTAGKAKGTVTVTMSQQIFTTSLPMISR